MKKVIIKFMDGHTEEYEAKLAGVMSWGYTIKIDEKTTKYIAQQVIDNITENELKNEN